MQAEAFGTWNYLGLDKLFVLHIFLIAGFFFFRECFCLHC